ncbi:lysine N(6)-hydroxylase/L-ornithine N(5)-oxygenase family protein [Salinimonas lutimaris]|uniref:lysine N(6)-hydroxylase/L-ornithine N(5)-oxygenase family protein n=1 Tax=Salinimonas lutimaris TaxID=914153 RepID=UPI0010BFE88F|nr:SidA/IucD/PvdA family monooxygenase [Salinimonas lutimaris]
MSQVYDFIGIGLGPFNLSLAALSEPQEDVSALFLERRPSFDWHPGMMLDDVTLQTPFMSDLVTMADPTSPYSFLNYAKQQGKLYSFYIRESFFLLRKEYNQYCQWVSQSLDSVRFNHNVTSVTYDEQHDYYVVNTKVASDHEYEQAQRQTFYARHLVLGTGPVPYIPECARGKSANIIHSGDYLRRKAELESASSVAIIGGGQSAAEIYHDLLHNQHDDSPYLYWLTGSDRYFPLEYTKLTLEMTSPEYVDYFYQLPASKRDSLNQHQKNLYKGINGDLINQIFDLLYQKNLDGPVRTTLKTHSRLTAVQRNQTSLALTFRHWQLEQDFQINADYVVLATGFAHSAPGFLQPLKAHLNYDAKQRFAVSRDYAIDRAQCRVFVQNAEAHTHGFVTPDLGMACYRNSVILNKIAGREVYPVEQQVAFQTFGLDDVEIISNPQRDEDAA